MPVVTLPHVQAVAACLAAAGIIGTSAGTWYGLAEKKRADEAIIAARLEAADQIEKVRKEAANEVTAAKQTAIEFAQTLAEDFNGRLKAAEQEYDHRINELTTVVWATPYYSKWQPHRLLGYKIHTLQQSLNVAPDFNVAYTTGTSDSITPPEAPAKAPPATVTVSNSATALQIPFPFSVVAYPFEKFAVVLHPGPGVTVASIKSSDHESAFNN